MDKIVKQVLFKICKRLNPVRSKIITDCAVVFHRPAVGHHHNHRLEFPLRVQIVQNNLGISVVKPLRFCSANAMQQVQNRVGIIFGITGRSVNDSLSCGSHSFGFVSYYFDGSAFKIGFFYIKFWIQVIKPIQIPFIMWALFCSTKRAKFCLKNKIKKLFLK